MLRLKVILINKVRLGNTHINDYPTQAIRKRYQQNRQTPMHSHLLSESNKFFTK